MPCTAFSPTTSSLPPFLPKIPKNDTISLTASAARSTFDLGAALPTTRATMDPRTSMDSSGYSTASTASNIPGIWCCCAVPTGNHAC